MIGVSRIHTLILEPDNYSPKALAAYRQLGPVHLGSVPGSEQPAISILVVRLKHYLDDALLQGFPNLRAIVTPTTGLTHLDLEACQRRGIQVFSLNDCPAAIQAITSTSELTLGLIIALLRAIPRANQDVIQNQRWERDRFRSRQLSTLTLGLIGLGRIGVHVAGYARALGMNLLAHDPYQSPQRFEQLGIKRMDLTALLVEADIVSLHADLRPDNHLLLGPSELAQMRPAALLINTARGALLDEAAAVNQLRMQRLGGIAVDVLADEHGHGAWYESPLVKAAQTGLNVIVTPHIGGCTSDAMAITEECLADHIVGVLRGGYRQSEKDS